MMNKVLADLIGAYGNTKRIRTLKQAEAVIEAEWAEKDGQGWWIAGSDGHRPASGFESELLDKADKHT